MGESRKSPKLSGYDIGDGPGAGRSERNDQGAGILNISIKIAELSDVDYLVRASIEMQEFHESLNVDIWRYSEKGYDKLKAMFRERILDKNERVFLAAHDNKVSIGFISGRIVEQENRIPGIWGHISRLYVEEPYRRHGIGTMLVNKLYDFFLINKIEDVVVRYVDGNSSAEKFWKGLGFNTRILSAGINLEELKENLNFSK